MHHIQHNIIHNFKSTNEFGPSESIKVVLAHGAKVNLQSDVERHNTAWSGVKISGKKFDYLNSGRGLLRMRAEPMAHHVGSKVSN